MKRKIPQQSLETYHKQENKKRRKSHRKMIIALLKRGLPYTTRQIAKQLNLAYNQVQKRVSDLKKEGLIVEIDLVDENGNKNARYKIAEGQQRLFKHKRINRFNLLQQAIEKRLGKAELNNIMATFNNLQTQ